MDRIASLNRNCGVELMYRGVAVIVVQYPLSRIAGLICSVSKYPAIVTRDYPRGICC